MECEGEGAFYSSCCGDPMEPDGDCDLCPTCGEHCGEGDKEICDGCNGLGYYFETETPEEQEAMERKNAVELEAKSEALNKMIAEGIRVSPHMPRGVEQGTMWFNRTNDQLMGLEGNQWKPLTPPVAPLPVYVLDEKFDWRDEDLTSSTPGTSIPRLDMTEEEKVLKAFEETGIVWIKHNKEDNEPIKDKDEDRGDYSIFSR